MIRSTIIFAPACSSFDQFKNFEERGSYFNQLIFNKINECYIKNFWNSIDKLNFILILILGLLGVLLSFQLIKIFYL